MDAVGVGCSCLACTSRSGYNITLVKMAAWYKTNVNQNIDLRQIIVCEGSPFHAAAMHNRCATRQYPESELVMRSRQYKRTQHI
jgi:hypothetical protein